jgi:hypothetical protein
LAALAVMAVSEFELVPRLAFILTWSILNFFWLAVAARCFRPPRRSRSSWF